MKFTKLFNYDRKISKIYNTIYTKSKLINKEY